MCFRVLRVALDLPAELGGRLAKLRPPQQGEAQVIMSFGHGRIEFQSLGEFRGGLAIVLPHRVGLPHRHMCVGGLRVFLHQRL